MMIDRSPIEKLLIGISAIPIAIIVNCIRITATALAYEFFSPRLAESIFHDLAGWLMMPMGLIILMMGLAILESLILPPEDTSFTGFRLSGEKR